VDKRLPRQPLLDSSARLLLKGDDIKRWSNCSAPFGQSLFNTSHYSTRTSSITSSRSCLRCLTFHFKDIRARFD